MFKVNLCKYSIKSADCQGVNNINLKVNIKKLTIILVNFFINTSQLTININQFTNHFLNKLINNCFLYAVFFSFLVIARVFAVFANSLLINVNLLTNSHVSFYWFFLLVFSVFLSYPRERVLTFDLGGLMTLPLPGVLRAYPFPRVFKT